MEHCLNDGCVEALTGPIERNDITTVLKHLNILNGKSKEIYKAVSRQVLDVAESKNENRDYSKMEDILK